MFFFFLFQFYQYSLTPKSKIIIGVLGILVAFSLLIQLLKFTTALSIDTANETYLENCASISDSNGSLSFYSNGSIIWNRNHSVMYHGTGLYSTTTVTNGSLIIPRPDHPLEYYLFHIDNDVHHGLFYAVIDMNLDQGLGGVESGKKNVVLYNGSVGEKLAAVKHANGRDWWIINHKSGADFCIYLLTPDTITLSQILTVGNIAVPLDPGEMIFSNHGDKLLFVGADGNYGIINLYAFDRCNGIISDFLDLSDTTNKIYYGCSFSPDDSKLYVSSFQYLYQYNLEDSDIIPSKQLIWMNPYYTAFPPSGFIIAQHQIAPNGKIFIPLSNFISLVVPDTFINESLCVINKPNAEGLSCDFIPNSFYLNGHRSGCGLPNSPNYNLGSLSGSPCDTVYTHIQENNAAVILKLYPNPFSNEVTVSIQNKRHEQYELLIYNLWGEKVYEYSFHSSSATLDLSDLISGMYLCELRKEKESLWRGKMVKE